MKSTIMGRKPLFKYLAIGLLSGVLFTACGKDEKEEPEPEPNHVIATMTFSDGRTIDYKGAVMTAVWLKEDGVNILSLTSTDKNFKNAVLTFGIPHADGPGTYSLASHELMTDPAKLIWEGMEWDNWMGYVTGDADGDGIDDGSGSMTIKTLNEQRTEGTFSMVMANDLGDQLTVEGEFNCKVTRQSD